MSLNKAFLPAIDVMYRLYGQDSNQTCANCKHYRMYKYDPVRDPMLNPEKTGRSCLIAGKYTSYKVIEWQDWPACGKFNCKLPF